MSLYTLTNKVLSLSEELKYFTNYDQRFLKTYGLLKNNFI